MSLTEHLDAAETLKHVPLEDREAIKYTLGASLVKSSTHWPAYETAFEIYFALRGSDYSIADEEDGADEEPGEADESRAFPVGAAARGRGAVAGAARG